MSKKPTVLMILDGFGLNDKTGRENAVAQAKKPNIDALMKGISICKRKRKRTGSRSSGRTDG